MQNLNNQQTFCALSQQPAQVLCRILTTSKHFMQDLNNQHKFCAESQQPANILCKISTTSASFLQNPNNQQTFCAKSQQPAQVFCRIPTTSKHFVQNLNNKHTFCAKRQWLPAQIAQDHETTGQISCKKPSRFCTNRILLVHCQQQQKDQNLQGYARKQHCRTLFLTFFALSAP